MGFERICVEGSVAIWQFSCLPAGGRDTTPLTDILLPHQPAVSASDIIGHHGEREAGFASFCF
jgi:hypothetical protein